MKLMFTQMVYNLRGTLWNLQHNTMFYENHLSKQVNFISSYLSLKKITGCSLTKKRQLTLSLVLKQPFDNASFAPF